MIHLTRLNGQRIVINPEVIESLEATPDTLISLSSGQKLAVLESVDEVEEKFVRYQRRKLWRPDLKEYREDIGACLPTEK
jgi:flagellar protein FlbD